MLSQRLFKLAGATLPTNQQAFMDRMRVLIRTRNPELASMVTDVAPTGDEDGVAPFVELWGIISNAHRLPGSLGWGQAYQDASLDVYDTMLDVATAAQQNPAECETFASQMQADYDAWVQGAADTDDTYTPEHAVTAATDKERRQRVREEHLPLYDFLQKNKAQLTKLGFRLTSTKQDGAYGGNVQLLYSDTDFRIGLTADPLGGIQDMYGDSEVMLALLTHPKLSPAVRAMETAWVDNLSSCVVDFTQAGVIPTLKAASKLLKKIRSALDATGLLDKMKEASSE